MEPSFRPTSPPTLNLPFTLPSVMVTSVISLEVPAYPKSPTFSVFPRSICSPRMRNPRPSKLPVNEFSLSPIGSKPAPSFQSVVAEASMSLART